VNFHLEQKFPSAVLSLESLAEQDDELATLLTEYEELCTWVATCEQSSEGLVATKAKELSHAREIVRHLEEEILQITEGLRDPVE
jgi:hypothetical protein